MAANVCVCQHTGRGQASEEGEPVLWPQGALSSCFGGCIPRVGCLRAPDTYHSYLSFLTWISGCGGSHAPRDTAAVTSGTS